MSNAHSSQVARLKALKAELEELNSPAKALGGDYDDVEALNKAKEELQREKEQCEQLRNEKDETNAELGRLRVEISASKQDATSPLSLHQVQAATRKLEAEIADCNAALKEAQKKEQQRSAEVMKRDRLYQEVVALAEDKKHLMEESQIASEQAALLLMDKQAYYTRRGARRTGRGVPDRSSRVQQVVRDGAGPQGQA
jgi:chromosome segregation ATPase